MLRQSLFIASLTLSLTTGCDHWYVSPIGYCFSYEMRECVQDGSEWRLQLTQYTNTDCTGDIVNEASIPCSSDEEIPCVCGEGICRPDQLMAYEYGFIDINNTNNTNSDEIECEPDNMSLILKEQCIMNNRQSVPTFVINKTDRIPQSYSMYCDEDEQQILYQGWDNNDCSGDGLEQDLLVLYDIKTLDDPEACAELICDDFILPSTEEIN